MNRYFLLLLLLIVGLGSWIWQRESEHVGANAQLFNNMSEQERVMDQQKTGSFETPRQVPAKTVAAKMDVVSNSYHRENQGGLDLVFASNSTSYLLSGIQLGVYGNNVPVELGGMSGYMRIKNDGEKLYQAHCHVCHGPNADGKGVMATYPEYPVMESLTAEKYVKYPLGQLYKSVVYGQGNMPSFKNRMTVAEIWAVCAYIRLLQDQKKEGVNE